MKGKYEQNLESMASVIKKLEMERTQYKNRASEEAQQGSTKTSRSTSERNHSAGYTITKIQRRG